MAEPNTPELRIFEESLAAAVWLNTRALPYRPISFSGKQRVEFTWYPGSPNATTQMLGPEESPISMKGFWKDAYVPTSKSYFSLEDSLVERPSVQQLVAFMDTLRRRGQVCVFQWGQLERIGHITEFTQTWHNVHDCEWELVFTPLGQNDSQVGTIVTATPISPQQTLGDLTQSVNDFNTKIANATSALKEQLTFFPLDSIDALGFACQQTLTLSSNYAYTAVTTLANNVLRPAEAGNRILTSLSQAIVSLTNTNTAITNRAITSVLNVRSVGGSVDTLPLAKRVVAYQYQRTWNAVTQGNATKLSQDFQQTSQTLQQNLLAVYTARQSEDLSAVSTKFYGRPDFWKQLMTFNGLTSSALTVGQVVLVPKVSSSDPTQLQTNPGY